MIESKSINKIIIICTLVVLVLTGGMIYLANTDLVTVNSGVNFDYETKLFDHDTIMTVDIQVDEDSWNSMIENALNEEYITCDVVINGQTYSNVGIRPKGNTSLTQIASDDTTDRFSFKIEFDHYDKNQNCYGLDKLVLNNVMSDTSYMKEYLSYDLMSYAGVVTPLYNYASIKVNGEDWGFYLALEGMEESFAMRNYGSSYGQLYKPETMGVGGGMNDKEDMTDMGLKDMKREDPFNQQESIFTEQEDASKDQGDTTEKQEDSSKEQENTSRNTDTSQNDNTDTNQMTAVPGFNEMKQNLGGNGMGGLFGGSSSSASLQYIDDDIDSYSTIFDAAVFDADDSDYERVITAIKNLNEGNDLEKYVDVDAVLRYIAANTVLVNLDSYFSNMQHNYYLYEEDGQITMLPWDYNLSFAGFQSGTATSAVNFPIDTPVSGIDLEDRPIIAKLFENEEYLERYHQILQSIVTGYFDSGLYISTINEIDTKISSYVKNDVSAFYTYDEYKTGVENMKEFGLLRAKSIQGQLDGTIPSTTAGQEADSSTLIDASSINLTAMGTQGGGNMNGGGGKMQGEAPQMSSDTSDETNADASADSSQMTPPQMPSGTGGETNADASADTDKVTPPQMPSNTSGNTDADVSADTNQMTPPQMPSDTNGETNSDVNANQFGNRGGMPNGFSGDMPSGMDNTENLKNEMALIIVCIVSLIAAIVVVYAFKRRKYRS